MTNANALPEFQHIRDALDIPRDFAPEVLAEAEAVAHRDPLSAGLSDWQGIPFVTIDPPGSRDLDQAFFAKRESEGYVVQYAIDDIGFFVDRGSLIEQAAWQRGLTLYSPDIRTPLYPPLLSEEAASLLPDVARPAIVFTFTLNSQAEVESCTLTHAVIRSRAKLAYPEVMDHLDAERTVPGSGSLAEHEWSDALALMEEIGRKREQLEIKRGGINLRIPSQQVERWSTAIHGYRLAFEEASAVEGWNAQISLMTGMAAAQLMLKDKVGLLRSLYPPRPERVEMLRLTALALQVPWPENRAYDDFIRSLDPKQPMHAVMLHQAAKVTGGARYVVFENEKPVNSLHSAIASHYAHVTAPLRRLADRYVLDLLLHLAEGKTPSAEMMETLRKLPLVMSDADRLSRQLESAIVDYAEARLMEGHEGKLFSAIVIGLRQEGIIVQITDPPIRTLIPLASLSPPPPESQVQLSPDGAMLTVAEKQFSLGQSLELRLIAANTSARSLSFSIES
ncbi:MAG: RNB domain-containing ribonuclease [Acidobacteria bacterium]|nr:RNB domain-containing ribonuclease [Acidobacteriota bacterium]